MTDSKRALRAHVEMQTDPNDESHVSFYIATQDGSTLTNKQIIEAVSEALVLERGYDSVTERWDVRDLDA